MIYFLDNSLQLQKIVTSKNVISAIHEHELNGLIRADVELDLSYANKFLILGIDHVGYYYKDEFYLHKIQRVEYDHVNESAKVVLRHIFFEDMIFGKLIQDVRPQNQGALTVSRQTIDANTRWQTIMTDVTGRLSTNFYWQVPYEVIEFMTENYRIEYLPKILFDGQNINGFQLHLANKIGEDKNIRIPYGSRVLDLKYEEDYSEIITKLVVHGKGEEVGDGYGRRINISDVNFNRNGVKSPVGSLYLEDESITNTYGNDGQTPREGRVVFEDIENPSELANAAYEHYLQVSRPQMLFTADVADIGDVGIGDSVMIMRREYDVYFNARIHKLSVDLLYPEDAQVELGDYKHFKESKIARKTREKNNRVQNQLSDRITRLKLEADERFDNEVAQWKSEYEQALIDVHAQIEADRENMTNLIEGTRTEMTVDFNQTIAETIEYAEQQAQAKASAVQTNLDSFKDSHQQLYDEVTGNVLDIDTFLGDKTITLKQQFDKVRTDFGTLQTDLSGVESDLTATKTDLQKQLDDARAELEGLEVGGRNLLLDSDKYNSFSGSGSPTFEMLEEYKGKRNVLKVTNPGGYIIFDPAEKYSKPYEVGQTYNVSFSAMYEGIEPTNKPTIYMNGSSGGYREFNNTMNNVSFTRINRTFTPSTQSTNRIHMNFSGYEVVYIVMDFMIVRGNLPMDWTPAPEDTEQKITTLNQQIEFIDGQLSAKLEQTDLLPINNKITEYGNSLTANAQSIESLISKTELHDGDITKWSNQTAANAEGIERRLTKVEYTTDKAALDADIMQWSNLSTETAKGLEQTIGRVSTAEGKLSNAELAIKVNADSLKLTATKTEVENAIDGIEVGGRNLILDSRNIGIISNNGSVYPIETDNSGTNFKFRRRLASNNTTLSTYTAKYFTAHEGGEYTQSVKVKPDSDIILKVTQSGKEFFCKAGEWTVLSVSFNLTAGEERRVMGIYAFNNDFAENNPWIEYKEWKVEKGSKATDWTPAPEDTEAKITKVSSDLEVEAGRIEGLVTDISKDYVKQSSVKVTSDRVTIGSTVVNGSTIGSVLSVSPTGIDAVADAMRLSGDLYVDGDITSLAVNAIEGNFSRLFASSLTTNVIKSNHIQTDTALAEKLFSTNANIDELITRTHFSNSIKTMSLDAVEANIGSIRTKILDSDVILSDHINSSNALIDKIFSSTAMFERMMAKSGFVSTLNTVTIDTDQLTIRRPDGVAWVSNGVYKFNLEIQRNTFMDPSMTFNGQNYTVPDQYWRTFENAYTFHNGRYLTASFAVGLTSWSAHNSAYIHVRVREFGSGSLVSNFKVLAPKSGTNFHNIVIDLGLPDFESPKNFYLEAKMDESRSDVGGYVRVNRLIVRG